MYRWQVQEEQTRRQERRDQDLGIRMREVGAERIRTRGGTIHEALTFREKEAASGRESLRSDVVGAGLLYIRRRQSGSVVDQATSGWESPR